MNRIIFLGVVLSLVALTEFYVWQGVRFLMRNQSANVKLILTISYWVLPVIVVLGILLKVLDWVPFEDRYWRLIVFGSLFINFLPKFVMLFFVFFDDLFRGGKKIVEQLSSDSIPAAGNKITRSEFILKTGLVAGSLPFVATSFGIISGAHDYRIRRKTIYYPNLPKEFDGIRLAQLSDIHTGSFFNKVAVQGGIDMLNAEKPDITFFTGDLVNDRAEEVRNYIDVFDKVKAPLGVHSVLGNHDYGMYVQWKTKADQQKNFNEVIHAHKELGWQILLNENRDITVDGQSISLLGVENWGHGFLKAGDLNKTYKGTEKNPFKILLSHDPSHWRGEVLPNYKDIDLTLSGHTHGMQMGIEIGDFQWSPAKYRYKEWGGLYTEGNQHIYVNRGYGYLGLPARIGMAPEITILELKKG